MTIVDYILEYEENGKKKANIPDYYDIFIKTLDKRFRRYSYKQNKLVLCFFKDHEDLNPSMGLINDKKHKGVQVCHCFGCGKTANIVRLHQILRSQWMGVTLNEQQACEELSKIFDIPLGDYKQFDDDDYQGKFEAKLHRINELKKGYTIRTFQDKMREQRVKGADLARVNNELIKIIATKKQLYS